MCQIASPRKKALHIAQDLCKIILKFTAPFSENDHPRDCRCGRNHKTGPQQHTAQIPCLHRPNRRCPLVQNRRRLSSVPEKSVSFFPVNWFTENANERLWLYASAMFCSFCIWESSIEATLAPYFEISLHSNFLLIQLEKLE